MVEVRARTVCHLTLRFPQLLPLDGELVLASGAALSAAGGDSDPACNPGEKDGHGSEPRSRGVVRGAGLIECGAREH